MFVSAIRPTVAVMASVGDRQRLWLDRVLAELGVTRAELARRIEVDPSTLTKFVNSRTGAALSVRVQEAIEQASGIPFAAENAEDWRPRSMREPEADPYKASGVSDPVEAAIAAMREGRNAVDAWVLRTRGLEEIGYLEGDIVLVDLNEAPAAGDVVCAQIYAPGMRAETVFRIYEKPWLVGAGPDSRRPIVVDDDHVVIKGVVIALVRPRVSLRAA